MKAIAVIDVNLEWTALGTASRLGDELAGVPVLRRTVDRVARAARLAGVFVICPAAQADACRKLIGDAPVTIHPIEAGDPPYRRLMTTARKWSLDGWRGGMGGATVLDEYTHSAVLANLGRQAEAEAVWVCGGGCAVVDPALIDDMIDHYEHTAREMQITFAPGPPGLLGTVFGTNLLVELANDGTPPGWILAYKPDAPQMDLAFKDCAFPLPEQMRHAAGRLSVETRRAMETVTELLADHPEPDGPTAGRWLIDRARTAVSPLPREVEIELTTEDQLPDTPLRPRGGRVPARGPIDPALVARVAQELAAYDDALIVLGGFGEPLLHPQFDEICRSLAEAGIFGVAVRTNGHALDERAIEALVRHRIHVVNVLLDAWSAELYQRINPGHSLGAVLARLDQLSQTRSATNQVEPLVVPMLTKTVETSLELDAFFDGWIRKIGWAVIEGFSHYAGGLEDLGVMDMSPPTRQSCRRLRSRCLILADGRLTRCDQDFEGVTAVGSLNDASLAELWHSPAMAEARRAHDAGAYADLPLCGACTEWHRP